MGVGGTVLLINHVYFVLSEERGLAGRFGAEYEEYKRHVPRWLPRLTAWRPPVDEASRTE